jgi:hypothetical protein
MNLIASYQGQVATKREHYQTLGRKEGGKNRPPADAVGLDGYEAELLGEANKHMADENHMFDQALVDAGRVATESSTKLTAFETKAHQLLADDSLEGKLTAELSSGRSRLEHVTERRLMIEAEYNWFREHHGIMEDAKYPESLLHHFGVVAVVFFCEAIANAYFYRNQGGLLGGFLVAVIISGLNLAVALALGWAFRYTNLSGLLDRLKGWGALAVFLVLTILFGALFASFRSEYQLLTDPGDPQQLITAFGKAWPLALGIFTFNFHFIDIFSFLLFWVSLLLSFVAFWKGYTSDDKYPGYSDKDRSLKAAIVAQQEAENSLRSSLAGQLERVQRDVEATIQEPRNLLDALAGKDATLQQVRNEMLLRTNRISADFQMVLNTYRQANIAVRTIAPPPYFQHTPELVARAPSGPYEAVRGQLSTLTERVRSSQEHLKSLLAEKKRQAQQLSSEVLNSAYPRYLAEVRKEAEATISRKHPTIRRRIAGAA